MATSDFHAVGRRKSADFNEVFPMFAKGIWNFFLKNPCCAQSVDKPWGTILMKTSAVPNIVEKEEKPRGTYL